MKFNFAEWRLAAEMTWDEPWFRWQAIVTISAYFVIMTSMFARLIPIGMKNGTLVFHYNLYLGIDDIRAWSWIFTIPCALGAIIAINLAASFLVFRHDRIMSRVLLGAATISTLLAAVGVAFIIIING